MNPVAPISPDQVFVQLAGIVNQPQIVWDNILFIQSQLNFCVSSLNYFRSVELITWDALKPIQQQLLIKFLKILNYPTYAGVFSGFDVDNPLWREVRAHSVVWLPLQLTERRQQFVAKNAPAGVSGVLTSLGHTSLFLDLNFPGGKQWKCLINPHEAASITIPEQGFFPRLAPPRCAKEYLDSPDVLLVTDLRADYFDPMTVKACAAWSTQIFSPSGFQAASRAVGNRMYNVTEIASAATFLFPRDPVRIFMTMIPPSLECSGMPPSGHSNSFMFTYPTGLKGQETEYNILILGRLECCNEKAIKELSLKISQEFPRVDLCVLAIDWVLDQTDRRYPAKLATALAFINPRLIFPIGWGTWAFNHVHTGIKDVWVEFQQVLKVHNLMQKLPLLPDGSPALNLKIGP